jgi:protein-tyrosine phosphatase
MIDTHCHLLPELDDGPRTASLSVALARRLVAEGVAHVLCTPHYTRQFPTSHYDALAQLDVVRRALAAHRLGLRTSLAAEVGPDFAVSAPLDELGRRSVASAYLIVEVMPDSPNAMFETVARRLAEVDLVPIYAHPERCRSVQLDVSALAAARQAGALVQVVAPSVLGRWGQGAALCAWHLLDEGLVDLLASDAHGPTQRTVHLREARAAVASHLGRDIAARLTETNPAAVLEGPRP